MSAAVIRFEQSVAMPIGPFRRLFAVAADSLRGLSYVRAAEKDERDGFPFTAAWEWQRAAECLGWISIIADRCWREWERIVHLPRRLAGPIGESEMTPVFILQPVAAPERGQAQTAESLVFALDSRAA